MHERCKLSCVEHAYLADKTEKTNAHNAPQHCAVHCVFAVNDVEIVFGHVTNLFYHFRLSCILIAQTSPF